MAGSARSLRKPSYEWQGAQVASVHFNGFRFPKNYVVE